jgi:RimJ/RimL family protein N-acetyltransferase
MLYAAEIGHWKIRGFGMWMIHDKATDEALGMAGGWQPAGWPEREIAWIVFPGNHGKGYGLEATDACRRYLYQQGWDGAVSYLDPKDLDSVRLAERLGCERDANAKTIDDNDSVYRHPAPAALKSSQLSDGIALEIAHYADPKFTPEGWALD